MLAYYGERWRGFKTQLTHDYIKHGEDKDKPPYKVYSFIDKATWKKFVESRRTPKILAKSQKERKTELDISIHMGCLVGDIEELKKI